MKRRRAFGSRTIPGAALAIMAGLAFTIPALAMGKPATKLMSPLEAKAIIDAGTDHVLLDVRTRDEHLERRIPNSVLLPYTLINAESAADVIPAKDSLVIIYCRSGRRSAIAADSLRALGYTRVYDLGGINDWPYETVRGAP